MCWVHCTCCQLQCLWPPTAVGWLAAQLALGCPARGRCTHMLEDGEAFKARARLRSVYSSEVGKGRPLLPAALQAERMVRELVDWATQMPLFATQLTGGHQLQRWSLACFCCCPELPHTQAKRAASRLIPC